MRFKEAWQDLDHNDLQLWQWPGDPTNFKYQRALEVRLWLEQAMLQGLFAVNRDDYRELLELSAMYLDAQV